MRLKPEDRPFVLGQQLRDAATRWLQPGEADIQVMDQLVLEQFLEAIPARTSAWVRYHRPRDLAAAVTLVEDHLAVQREARREERHRHLAGRAHSDRTRRRRSCGCAQLTLFLVLPCRSRLLRIQCFPRRRPLKRLGRRAGGMSSPVTCVRDLHPCRLTRRAEGWELFCPSSWGASTAPFCTSAGSSPIGRRGTAPCRGSASPSGGRSVPSGTTSWGTHSASARTTNPSNGSTA
ncbi:uncharacterized protein LOC133659789 [Entelurus aequoreus]|uniref:uncharacterized protein LOC133659789 n=1 Tax=Entelurus aequoreus TaxID=161455 RepID=UPI002B1E6305|nr:uncharacterized protein LOC133659789 [Entelurus aequoreus]